MTDTNAQRDDSKDYRRSYRTSRTRLQHGYLLAATIGVIGVAVIVFGRSAIPDATLIGAVHLAASVGLAGYLYRLSRDAQPRLVIDESGIRFRDWQTRAIPWALFRDAYIAGSRLNSYLAVEVLDADRLMHIIPAADRKKFQSNRLVNLPRLFIPNHAVEVTLQQLRDDILAAAGHYGR